MKYRFLTLLLIFSAYGFSQNSLPIIKANTKSAIIEEEGQPVTKWNLSPQIKMDAYTTNKLIRPVTVKLKTDIDSIRLTIKPGQQKDFIVLLNGKDSCYTRIQSPAVKDFSGVKPEIHDTISLGINKHNTIFIKTVMNKTDTLNLNFDSGATELVLTEDALRDKVKSKLNLYNQLCELNVGGRMYKSFVYDVKVVGHETDGLLGWDNFDGMIVELNYDKNIMAIHSKLPKAVKRDKTATKLKMKFFNKRFFIETELEQNGTKLKDWFLFDTGYQRAVMLDNDLLKKENFPADQMKVIRTQIMKGTMNNEIPVVISNLENLKIGKYELKNVPAQLLTSNKPMPGARIHILGNEILKRFNVFMDFQDNVVYLQPNHFFNTDYIEKT